MNLEYLAAGRLVRVGDVVVQTAGTEERVVDANDATAGVVGVARPDAG